MPVTVVVGCQWGDEGKGKVVDHLSRGVDWVARYQGGPNAGHTVVIGRERYILHLVPSGILHPKPRCVIGHGVVIDPVYLLDELDDLVRRGISLDGRFFVSEGAHVILPYHRWLESLEGDDVRVGTTRRGVGPAYEQKAGRTGVRLCEMMEPTRFRARLEEQRDRVATRFRGMGKTPPEPLDAIVPKWMDLYSALAERLRPFVTDTVPLLLDAHQRGEKILCEGAQGTFLDLDFGTYPFVTSSTTTAAGASTGLGLPPAALRKVVGICKAYATRVGEGPFVTELPAAEGEALRERGSEFGATTGRPRRVGWLDLVQLRHAVRINGVTELVLTKLDILSGQRSVCFCTRYRLGRREITVPPVDTARLAECEPLWDEVPGWDAPLGAVRRVDDLPREARDYIARIEAVAEAPIRTVSVGSSRSAMVRIPRPSV